MNIYLFMYIFFIWFIYLYFLKRVDISMVNMVVICYTSDTIEYSKRTTELSKAPLHVTHKMPTV